MQFTFFSVSIKNLRRKPFRTGILLVSIALLVSIIVFGTSFIMSVTEGIERASDRLGADLLVVPVGAREVAQDALLETKVKVFYMDKGLMDEVRKVEGIDRMTYQTYLSTIQGVCCDIPAAKVVIFNQETDFIIKPWLSEVLGRKLEKNEVIVGHGAFENFDLALAHHV